MATTRIGRPVRLWTHYPAAFFEIVQHFRNSRDPLVLPCGSEASLHATRTSFYRFCAAIRREYDENNPGEVEAAASGLSLAYFVANNVFLHKDGLNLCIELTPLADKPPAASVEDLVRMRSLNPNPKPANNSALEERDPADLGYEDIFQPKVRTRK